MIINHNMSAINANRQMAANQSATAKSTEKLSSGLRINRAGDDAAGLAISEKMRAQISGLTQASRNAQDGISMIQTAEGALNESHSILQRMRELSVQAGNDTNTETDRKEIQKEIDQLTSEVNRIGGTTEFNNQKILQGGEASVKVNQVGSAQVTANNATLTIGGVTLTAAGTDAFNGLEVEIKSTGSTTTASYTDGKLVIDIGSNGGEDAAGKIDAAVKGVGTAGGFDFNKLTATGTADKSTASGTLTGGVTGKTEVAGTFEISGKLEAGKITVDGQELSIKGDTQDELYASLADAIDNNTVLNATYGTGNKAAFVNGSGKLTLTQEAGQESDKTLSVSGQNKTVNMQIGANEGQRMAIEFSDMRAEALGIVGTGSGFTSTNTVNNGTDNVAVQKSLDVTTSKNAGNATTVIQSAIDKVSSERSKLGAYQNRLEHTINNLGTSSENLTSAESRIRDVNMAEEMMEFTKNNVLSQASQAMLAQAKALPNQVLSLLQ